MTVAQETSTAHAGPVQRTAQFAQYVRDQQFDFLDFGCSKGGSIQFAMKHLTGAKGLGIDISQAKVDTAVGCGFDAMCYDILDIPDEKLVRFVVLSHFLEHVPDRALVKAFIRKACSISTDFVYIQQPFFDADGYLLDKGLKLYWSDWRGHPNRMTTFDLWAVLSDLQREGLPLRFSIHGRVPIIGSDDPRIHPLATPPDQHAYDASQHSAKDATLRFDSPVFAETICIIALPGFNRAQIARGLRYDHTYFDGIRSADSAKIHKDAVDRRPEEPARTTEDERAPSPLDSPTNEPLIERMRRFARTFRNA